MDKQDAEEFTESLGLIAAGGWRQAALGERLGVPEALGLTTREWIQDRLGGYLKLSVIHRREAVDELTEEGMSKTVIADVLGVGEATVQRDRAAIGEPVAGSNDPDIDPEAPAAKPEPEPIAGSNDPPAEPEPTTVCPTCRGLGWIPKEQS